jgi:hypothetical protein
VGREDGLGCGKGRLVVVGRPLATDFTSNVGKGYVGCNLRLRGERRGGEVEGEGREGEETGSAAC